MKIDDYGIVEALRERRWIEACAILLRHNSLSLKMLYSFADISSMPIIKAEFTFVNIAVNSELQKYNYGNVYCNIYKACGHREVCWSKVLPQGEIISIDRIAIGCGPQLM